MKIRLLLTIIILSVLGLIAAKSVDFQQLSSNIRKFPQMLLIVAILLSLSLTVIKTWRLRVLLKKNNIEPPVWPSYRLFVASQAITALPGGEASRAYLVTKESHAALHEAATPVLLQALLELFPAVVVVIFCSFFYPQMLTAGLIALALLLITLVILTNNKILTFLLEQGSRWSVIKSHQLQILTMQKDLNTTIFKNNSYLPSQTIIYAFLLGILTDIVGGVLIKVIAQGFGQSISLFNSVFVYAGGVAIQGLSTVSPGGIGFTEGGMTGILTFFGINSALEIVLIYRFVTFIFYTLIGLLFIILFYRKDLLFAKKTRE